MKVYNKNKKYEITYEINRNIFFRKRYKQKLFYITKIKKELEEQSKEEITLEELLKNNNILKEKTISKTQETQIFKILNNEEENILKKIEEKYKNLTLQKRKDRKGKRLKPSQDFFTATKEEFCINIYQTNILKKFLSEIFDFEKGIFIEYKKNKYKKIKEYGSLIRNDYIKINIQPQKTLSYNKLLIKIEEILLKKGVNYNNILLNNMLSHYIGLTEYLNITSKKPKHYLKKHILNFNNEQNQRTISILNLKIFKEYLKIFEYSQTKMIEQSIKFRDFKYKSFKSKTAIDIINNVFLKKAYLWNKIPYKYNRKLIAPTHSIFYEIEEIEKITNKEDKFFKKFYLFKSINVLCEALHPEG